MTSGDGGPGGPGGRVVADETDAGAGEPLVGRGSAGRGHSPIGPSVPRPQWTPPRRGRPWSWAGANPAGARLGLGVALAVGLGLAWLFVGRPGAGSAVAGPTVPTNESFPTPPHATTTTAPTTPAPVEHVVAVPAWVPAAIAATCRAHAGTPARTTVVVDCTPGRGVARLELRAFASVARLRAAYANGSIPRGGIGAAACAQGVAEERSWSTAAAPTVPVGRYRCSVAEGHARIAWTSEHAGAEDLAVLGVATRSDADLRALYQWWTTVPGPTPTGPEAHERRDR